jgi:hypothetical protein
MPNQKSARRLARTACFAAAAALFSTAPAAAQSSAVAGRYAVVRADKDTGCMVTLHNMSARGGLKAQLAPACRDNGLVVFDPIAWALERGGRLALTARKGHKAHFDRQPDGSWQRDAKEGKAALTLKPI